MKHSIVTVVTGLIFLAGCSGGELFMNPETDTQRTDSREEPKIEVKKAIAPVLKRLLINENTIPHNCYGFVYQIDVEFDRAFSVAPQAFFLIRKHDGAMLPLEEASDTGSGIVKKAFTLVPPSRFAWPLAMEGDSPGTGEWKIYLDLTKVRSEKGFDPDVTSLGSFKRLFADSNDNCAVDGIDFGAFRTAFGTYAPRSAFDAGNGYVDGLSFAFFRMHFGTYLGSLPVAPIPSPPATPPVIPGAPIGDFAISAITGLAPFAVHLTDKSSNATAWHWYLGVSDASISSDQNLTYVFQRNGDYTITLIPENAAGLGRPKTIAVHVGQPLPFPRADFTTDENTHWHQAQRVHFWNTSIGEGTVLWNFGDGTTSTEQNPVHQYTDAGSYDVSLTVTNYRGTDTLRKPGLVSIDGGETFQTVVSDELAKVIAGSAFPNDFQLYSTYDPANLKYVRNPTAWTTRAGIDLTAVALWNSDFNSAWKVGTVVAPQYIVTANHWPISVGATIHFLGHSGKVLVRHVREGYNFDGTDSYIQRLDEPLPEEEVTPVSMISTQTLARYYNADRERAIEAFHTNQQMRAVPNSIYRTSPNVLMQLSTHPELAPFSSLGIPGDSGNPIFLLVKGRVVLASTFYSGGSGPSYFDLFDLVKEWVGMAGQSLNIFPKDLLDQYPKWF